MLAQSGGCGTRFAQTALAVLPDSAELLSYAKDGQPFCQLVSEWRLTLIPTPILPEYLITL